jgi:endonuclease-3
MVHATVAKKKLNKQQVLEVVSILRGVYPDATCELDFKNAFQLLTAVILSAQTTDKRVNMTTPALFAKYPTPQALAKAEQADVEELVKSTGFYRNKAKSIIGMAKALVERHGGEVPRTLDELIQIPGAARKTANVVLGTAFRIASGVVVDTHVQRLSQLIGLTDNNDVKLIEQDLMKIVPQDDWIDFSHFLILHGRRVCIARKPLCDDCALNKLCMSAFDPKVGYVPKDAAPDTKKKKVVVETKQQRHERAIAKKAKRIASTVGSKR